MHPSAPSRFTILVFSAMLASVPLIQTVVEARRGECPAALQVFAQPPTEENLRSYERTLQASSVTAGVLRPIMQALQFFALRDAGEKALVGRDGWLVYQPGVSFLTQRPRRGESTARDALAAVVHFRDALAARGIRLIVMPVPNKESTYPDMLVCSAAVPVHVIGDETRVFLAQCQAAGIELVDLFALYRARRQQASEPLYLAQDSHWSPAGMELAANAVAQRIGGRRCVSYDRRPVPTKRSGDLVEMLRSPQIAARLAPESMTCTQIIHHDTGVPYTDDVGSDVLVLGDSFLRIYQQDEPGSAGLVAHLAAALGRPLASIINDGGASTLVRQELFRRPQLLTEKSVVVWEFVERDIRLGTEGWQLVPLPPPATSTMDISTGS